MKQKIVFPTLVANLAILTGKSKKQCEDFLRDLFNTLEETLTAGECVKIKGLGTFKIIDVDSRKSVDVNTGEDIEIPGHKKVTFVAARELAERVNEPFAIFESVEIPEEDSEKSTTTVDKQSSVQSDNNIDDIESEPAPEKSDETEPEMESELPYPNDRQLEEESQAERESEQETDNAYIEEEEVYNYVPEPKKRFKFLWGFITGIVCSVIVIAGIYLLAGDSIDELANRFSIQSGAGVNYKSKETVTTKLIQDTAVPTSAKDTVNSSYADAEIAVPTVPSDEIVYDTISRTRYLTTMAKEHYGNYNLWPYIYIENQKMLGHPDRIKPGTPVVVPKLSKYGVDPANAEDIKRAKQKGLEIYAKYQ